MGANPFIKAQGSRSWRRLSSHDLARIGWYVFATAAVTLLILSLPGFLTRRPLGDVGVHLRFEPRPLMLILHRLNLVGAFLSVVLSIVLAWILFRRSNLDRMALFTAYYLIVHGLLFAGTVEMLEPLWPQAAAVNSFILLPLITFPLTIILFAIFPDGQFVPSWIKRLIPLSLAPVLFSAPRIILGKVPTDPVVMNSLVVLTYGTVVLIVLLVVAAQIYRYRHVSTRDQKQQTKWVLYGFLLMIGLFAIASGPWEYARALPAGTIMPWWVPLVEACWILAVLAMPVTLTISIMRYRLYDLDNLVNRTLVYAILSGFVVGLYILIVGGMGFLFQAGHNFIFSLVATGLVAVLFDPFRRRLQDGVNKFMYGNREEPFSVLQELGQRLENSGMPADLLNVIVETIVKTLKLPFAEIVLYSDGSPERIAGWGDPRENLDVFKIHHQGQEIGSLNVALRSPNEPLSDSDRTLIRHIASQAGTIAYAVQLTRELRRSRARIVRTREQERRRLYRDLHDGLGPVLASQGLKVAAAQHILEDGPEEALDILNDLAKQNEATVAEIRRLVYALRPPELDELGLIRAVREYVAGLNAAEGDTSFKVRLINLEANAFELPSAVEVSAYRIATEALANVTRHAGASACTVLFSMEESHHGTVLCLEIIDNGVGISNNNRVGIGLKSMRERAEEIGGQFALESDDDEGTRIMVRLPVAG